MGFLFPSFDKPGKGIDPDAPQKRAFFRFFDIFFRKFWHFVRANLLYSLALIPAFVIIFYGSMLILVQLFSKVAAQIAPSDMSTVMIVCSLVVTNLYIALWGAGPATAGMTYIMRNFSREEHAFIWGDFKDTFKANFKQSLAVFVIDIVVVLLSWAAITVYSGVGGPMGAMRYVVYVFLVIYSMMHFYIYPIMVTFELKLKDIYKNAMLFTISKLPSNLFALLMVVLIHAVLPICAIWYGGIALVFLLIIVLEPIIVQAFSLFIVNFNAYPKLKKYMLDVKEEPEEEI